MPSIHLETIRELSQPVTSNKFYLSFGTPPVGVTIPDDFNVRCQSVDDLPKATFSPGELQLHGWKIGLPGAISYKGQITIQFIESYTAEVHEVFRQWREAMTDPLTGEVANKLDSETTLTLHLLDNNWHIWKMYTLIGVSLEDYSTLSGLTGEDTGTPTPMSMTLGYDSFLESGPLQ